MTAGWVAASTRGQAMMRRLVGVDRARTLARVDWPDARQALTSTIYGKHLATEAGRDDARQAAMEATSWQLRVLSGWLPPGRSGLARVFAAPIEIANVERHLASLWGIHNQRAPISLGSLATAWPRVARATSPEMLRAALAASVWGDPGGVDRATISLGLRLGWARRLAVQSPTFEPWVKGAAAVLIARERFAFDRTLNEPTGRVADSLIGTRWRSAGSVPELAGCLPADASWSLVDLDEPAALWQAECAVARRVALEAKRLADKANPCRDALIGIMALLLIDLRHVLVVIELAGRHAGGDEVFDAVA